MGEDEVRYKAFKDLGRILSLFEVNDSGDESVSDIAKNRGPGSALDL